jgi:hypothetical protein
LVGVIRDAVAISIIVGQGTAMIFFGARLIGTLIEVIRNTVLITVQRAAAVRGQTG